MAINTELLLKVKERILSEPDAFDMGDWGANSMQTRCGTVACIAGHAVHIHSGQSLGELGDGKIAAEARRILGLTPEASMGLFYLSQWPNEFFLEYADADTDAERAKVAADRIDSFIATHSAKGEQQ